MPEVVFLGTGGAFSAGRRGNVALLIEADDFRMLVECGPAIVQQLARSGVRACDIDRLFVSHSHGDHVLGFPMLALGRLACEGHLRVYAGSNTIATLKMLWVLSYADFDSHYLKTDWHRLSEHGPVATSLCPGVNLQTVPVPHPPGVQTLAARWDFADGVSIAFVTDTTANDATVELASGCGLLVHEASYSAVLQPDEDPAVHFHTTAQQAGEIARRAGCPRLALVHLGPEISEHPDVLVGEACAGTDLEVVVPEDGQRIRVEASDR